MNKTSTKKPKGKPGRPPIHGAWTIVRRGELPERRRDLRAVLEAFRAGLIHDRGPLEDDLTAAQLTLINETVTVLGVLRCIGEHVAQAGVFKGGVINPALSTMYLAYQNTLRLNLMALGLNKRKASDALDLGRYIDAKSTVKTRQPRQTRTADKDADKDAAACPQDAQDERSQAGDGTGHVCKCKDKAAEIARPGASGREIQGDVKVDDDGHPPFEGRPAGGGASDIFPDPEKSAGPEGSTK